MSKRAVLEVIALDAEDAVAAQAGGADRLELVTDMAADGLTPPRETFAAIRAAVDIPLRVMLRLPTASPPVLARRRRRWWTRRTALRAEGAEEFVLGFLDRGRDTGPGDGGASGRGTRRLPVDLPPGDRPGRGPRRAAQGSSAEPVPGLDTYPHRRLAGRGRRGAADAPGRGGSLGPGRPGYAPRILVGGGLGLGHLPVLRAAGIDAFHIGGAARPAGWAATGRRARYAEWRAARWTREARPGAGLVRCGGEPGRWGSRGPTPVRGPGPASARRATVQRDYSAQRLRQRRRVHHGQARDRAGQADVQPAQAGALVRFAVDDRGRLVQHHVVVLQALGERGRDQRQPGVGGGLLARARGTAVPPLPAPAASAGIRASAAIRPIEPSCAATPRRRRPPRCPDVPRVRASRTASDPGDSRTEATSARPGRDRGQQPGRVRDDLARHAEARRQLLDHRVRLAQVGQRLLPTGASPTGWCPGRGRRARSPNPSCSVGPPPGTAWGRGPAPRRGPHGPASACAPPGRWPRRSAPRPRRTTSPTSRSARAWPTGSSSAPPRSGAPPRASARKSGVGEQPQHQLRRIDRRPDRLDRRLHRGHCGPPRPAPGRPAPRRPAPSVRARRARCAAAGRRARRRSGCRGPATPVRCSSSSYAGHPPAPGAAHDHHRARPASSRASGRPGAAPPPSGRRP